MATTDKYPLPGVYTSETYTPRVNTTGGGNASIAFVGPAIGYRTASQRITLDGTTPVSLLNSGVIADSYNVVGASNGFSYNNNEDYVAINNSDGTTTIARLIRSTSTTKQSVTNKVYTYFSAQPSFSILFDSEGAPIDGYIIAGTVVVKDSEDKTYVEDVDFAINYYTGVFSNVVGGSLINATQLSISFDWTTAEPVELPGEASATLSHQFVSKTESGLGTLVIVSSQTNGNNYGDTPDGTSGGQVAGGYVEDVDFVVDYQTGRITRTSTSRIPEFIEADGNYMYAAYSYDKIRSGDTVIVSYNYRSADYTQAQKFSNYNECINVYGSPWAADGSIQSPLSLAIYIATKSGLGDFWACACEPVSYAGSEPTYSVASFESALSELTKVSPIDIVVPVSGQPEVWAAAQTHIAQMKENQDERRIVLGADGTGSPISDDQMIAYARSIASEDVEFVSPSTFNVLNGVNNVVDTLPGYYAAACVAGWYSSHPQYEPITHKTLLGLYGQEQAESKTAVVKSNMRNAGLMYIDQKDGAMMVIQGVTTSTDSVIRRESNIQMCKQYIMKNARQGFSNGFIGTAISAQTLLDIKSSMVSLLTSWRSDGYLYSFTDPGVTQDTLDPTQINIVFDYQPTYGVNYIRIEFSINSATVNI